MSVAVVSDTHGNTVYMDRVLECICSVHQAEMLLHLGDSYSDGARMLKSSGLEGAVVPGIYCDEYHDRGFPNTCLQYYGDWRLLLVHALKDYTGTGAGPDVNIVLYGHTHTPDFENRAGIYFINPGHLKEEISKGQAPTYGILRTEGGETVFEWYHPFEYPVLCRRELLL